MHNHDHDLIAALAEGILAEELSSAAEAEINACPVCSPELAAQRLALDALRTAQPAAMTQTESAILRDAVAGALGVTDTSASLTSERSRRSPWPAIAIAAGLAGIITIVPVMGLLTTGSDDAATSETVAAAFAELEDGAAAERDALGSSSPEDAEMAPAVPSELPAESAEAPEFTGAPGAPTTTLALSEASLGADFAVDGQAAIRDLFDAGPSANYSSPTEQEERSVLACIAEAEKLLGDAFLHLNLPASLDDGRPVVLYAAADWSSMVAFDPVGCAAAMTLP